jgi:hypothetical protein
MNFVALKMLLGGPGQVPVPHLYRGLCLVPPGQPGLDLLREPAPDREPDRGRPGRRGQGPHRQPALSRPRGARGALGGTALQGHRPGAGAGREVPPGCSGSTTPRWSAPRARCCWAATRTSGTRMRSSSTGPATRIFPGPAVRDRPDFRVQRPPRAARRDRGGLRALRDLPGVFHRLHSGPPLRGPRTQPALLCAGQGGRPRDRGRRAHPSTDRPRRHHDRGVLVADHRVLPRQHRHPVNFGITIALALSSGRRSRARRSTFLHSRT